MTETKIPRAHAELAIKFYSDSKMDCWSWKETEQQWYLVAAPSWYVNEIYEVCEHRPKHPPKKRVTLAGITFNAPETKAPEPGTRYWYPDTVAVSVKSFNNCWKDSEFDRHLLERGSVHLNKGDAELHAEALIKLNRELK